MHNLIDTLQERGFIEAMTHEELREKVAKPMHLYCGFDPTSDCLHLGHLVPIVGLSWFQRFGHRPVVLVGGATGMIGDPSGKKSERLLLDKATIEKNVQGIAKILQKILGKGPNGETPLFLNNADWFDSMSFIDFLRDVGKQFRLSTMLAKDSVKQRLESEDGMSFTEFCYQLLQAYDFLYLFKNYEVSLQLGGSDQWGNITAGTDLIRKELNATSYGITFPLLVRSDGQKFGKSEKGAIWLSADKLSPYEFYQYLVRVPDADVIKLLRLLTFLDMAEIRHYEKMMSSDEYEPNSAQRRLAAEVTEWIHGKEGLELALRTTQNLAPGKEGELTAETLAEIAKDIPICELPYEQGTAATVAELFVLAKLCSSNSEARRLIKQGGAYINNSKQEKEQANSLVGQDSLIDKRYLLLSAGKKNKVVVSLM
jgi:tyrosyl-tRNA synthetase